MAEPPVGRRRLVALATDRSERSHGAAVAQSISGRLMTNLTLRQLEYFVAVADAGSVTAAAKRLLVAQSAVSASIADLERSLEIQLFIRHARGLSLTREGREILGEVKHIVHDLSSLEDYAQGLKAGISGSLVVGCYSTLAAPMLPPLLGAFAAKYPLINIDFVVGSAEDIVRLVQSGECDVALTYDYLFDRGFNDLHLESHHLTHRRPYALLHPDHPLASEQEVSLADLAEDPLILLDLTPGGDYFLSLFKAEGVEPNVRYRSGDFGLVHGLVARGLGYSVLSQRTAIRQSYEGRRFATAELSARHTGLDVVALTPALRLPNRRARAFIRECVEVFGQEEAWHHR